MTDEAQNRLRQEEAERFEDLHQQLDPAADFAVEGHAYAERDDNGIAVVDPTSTTAVTWSNGAELGGVIGLRVQRRAHRRRRTEHGNDPHDGRAGRPVRTQYPPNP